MHPCPSPSRLLFLSSWPHYRNAGLPTIEEELLKALSEVGAIKKDFNLGQLGFQRCSRTDKGVSAARQVVSLKISVCLLYVCVSWVWGGGGAFTCVCTSVHIHVL